MKRNEKFTIDYRKQMLKNIFEEKGASFSMQKKPLTQRDVYSQIDKAEVICIAADFLSKADEMLLDRFVDGNKRIYLLLGRDEDNKSVIQKYSGQCLIVTGVRQSGTLVLTDMHTRNGSALLFPAGDIFQASGLNIDDDDSKKWLYQTFCYLFWFEAKKVYKTRDGKAKDRDQDKSLIYDIPVLKPYSLPGRLLDMIKPAPAEDSDDEDKEKIDLTVSLENTDWLKEIHPNKRNCSSIGFVLPENNSSKDISEYCDKTEQIYLCQENQMSWKNIALCERHYLIYLPEKPSKENVNWAARELKEGGIPQAWEFSKEKPLSSLTDGSKIMYADDVGNNSSVTISETDDRQLGDVYAETMDEYNLEPQDLCDKLGLVQFDRKNPVKSVNYTVTVHPPYLPDDAKETYLDWDKVQSKWEDHLKLLEDHLTKYEEHRRKTYPAILKKLTGFEQKKKEYLDEVNELRDFRFDKSTTPGLRTQKKESYDELAEKIAVLTGDDESDCDYEKTLEEWEEKVEKTDSEAEKLRKKLSELENKKNDKDGKKKDTEKETDKLKKQLQDTEAAAEKLKKEKPQKDTGNNKDPLAKILGNKEKEIRTFEGSYPHEELPVTGTLYVAAKDRYLLISSVEKVDAAKKDAERLNANICVRRED